MSRILAGLMAALLVAGCSSIPSPSSGSPTPFASTPQPPSEASSPAAGAPTVDCGPLASTADLATCFSAVATAASGLVGDQRPLEKISVISSQPTGPEPTPTVDSIGSTTVSVEPLRLEAYRIHFGLGGGGFLEVPVYLGADQVWGSGPTPSDGKRYSIAGDLAAWTDQGPFVLEAFIYQVDGRCFGTNGRKATGTMILERVAPDGSITEVHRATCGPAELGDAFGDRVDLAQGTYRVRFENVIVGMSAQLGAVGAAR